MTLNKAQGRMFQSVGWTWNPIAGCTHGCLYCYARSRMKRWGRTFEPQLREHFFKDKMPNDGTWIFVGSMGDVFCRGVPDEWILKLLTFIKEDGSNNIFLLQTKNPNRFQNFIELLEEIKDKVVLGTTLETTWQTPWSTAPPTDSRAEHLRILKQNYIFTTFLSLEPLSDFNPITMKRWIFTIKPEAIEIGRENYTKHVVFPSDRKIVDLLKWLNYVEIPYILKENLRHLEEEAED